MPLCPMRYFLFVSLAFLLLASCSRNMYKDKKEARLATPINAKNLRPAFEKVLYRATIDGSVGIRKFHLSGILYLRNLEESKTRVIFQSEMGNTFFDFGWDETDSFTVHHIITQMNREALIKTLRKDFELLLVKNIPDQPSGAYHFKGNQQETYLCFEREKGVVYYVLNKEHKLKKIEHADGKRKIVELILQPESPLNVLSDSIIIKHLRAGFTINLEKIPDHVTE